MHVVVVGGGVVGTTLAAALVDGSDDASVTLCERDELGCGTTSASAAVFTTQQPRPSEYDEALRERAWATYEPLVESGALSYERVGHLTVAESDEYAETLREAVGPLRSFGYDAEWVPGERLGEFDLDGADYRGALYTPEEGYFDVDELVAAFADRAREGGADVRTGEAVTDVLVEDGAVAGVETDRETLRADAVVNAAGPWALAVDGLAGASVPLRHTVGPILVVAGDDHAVPFSIFESRHYVRPVGGDAAYVGKYLTDWADGEVLDPDDPVDALEAFRGEADAFLDRSVPPLADGRVVDEWVGLRTVTPDGHPVVGESAVTGFYEAVGMSGLGVTLAPAVADLLAAEIRGEATAADERLLEPLSPERF
ncbi:NAD(P)/FAD-dependent oxidoreductase [Halobacterium yunchengense]|uniref:NAD(P)/FAD-dependent oxidoreductase n=1 Tax=Halobacterium yunchengense TaxID=3108497 RepID=UPI00300AF147